MFLNLWSWIQCLMNTKQKMFIKMTDYIWYIKFSMNLQYQIYSKYEPEVKSCTRPKLETKPHSKTSWWTDCVLVSSAPVSRIYRRIKVWDDGHHRSSTMWSPYHDTSLKFFTSTEFKFQSVQIMQHIHNPHYYKYPRMVSVILLYSSVKVNCFNILIRTIAYINTEHCINRLTMNANYRKEYTYK
jgi:hypothetical protein